MSVTSTGAIITAGSYAIYGSAGTAWTIGNAGSLAGHNGAISLASGEIVTNSTDGTINGDIYVVKVSGAMGFVTNAGTIVGSFGGFAGVYLGSGGTVTNEAGGVIADYQGVLARSGVTSIDNAGTISGLGRYGVYLNLRGIVAGSILANASSGKILGGAIILGGGATVSNAAGGVIYGYDGVNVSGGGGSVINAGTVKSASHSAIFLGDGGTVINTNSGVVSGPSGVFIGNNVGFVSNAGVISNIYIGAGGIVTNSAGGTISAGIRTSGGTVSIINSGKVAGVYLGAGGVVTNTAGATLVGGVESTSPAGATVSNSGTIIGVPGGKSIQFSARQR